MPRSTTQHVEELSRKLRQIETRRLLIEQLAADGNITDKVATEMYEGLFLAAHIAFESFLEELFIGLLLDGRGLVSSRNDIYPRITVRSHKVAREILTSKRKPFIDWFPYERTLELAAKYFRGSRPFDDLTQHEKDTLAKCHKIRNLIAHDSRDTRIKFERHVIADRAIPPAERTASGYLRGLFRSHPPQTRLENMTAQILTIARKLGR